MAASTCNKFAIMDQACNEIHATDWDNVKVIDRRSDMTGRRRRQAI